MPTPLKFKFFLAAYHSPQQANYGHNALALAEGFKELGITFYGNIDYWNPHGDGYTINQSPEGYKYDVAIYSDGFLFQHISNIHTLLNKGTFNILLDSSGFPWLNLWRKNQRAIDLQRVFERPEFAAFDLILRSHYTDWFKFPSNVMPWAFGLTNRIIYTVAATRHLPVANQVALNFRIQHDVRKEFISRLTPLLEPTIPVVYQISESLGTKDKKVQNPLEQYYWANTGRRHSQDYYEFINSSRFTYSFGGLIDYKYPDNAPLKFYNRVLRFLKTKAGIEYNQHKHLIFYQHDSWRFWEVLLSNGIPIHMDFEDWLLTLPQYPTNGVHYLGVKGFNVKEVADLILSSTPEQLQQIADNGRLWVLEHYAPKPVAERLLNLLHQRMGK